MKLLFFIRIHGLDFYITCDEHDWVGGRCAHDELEDHTLPWFDRRDKDFEALQKIILEPQLLASFKSYVRFR